MNESISILGSGWLGLPLAEYLALRGHLVKASTTSNSRLPEIASIQAEPFIVDIGILPINIQSFLKSNVLIINTPSKDIDGFSNLIKVIEKSEIEKVLFVSSTSVYKNTNETISESEGRESISSPLLTIENLFRKSRRLNSTIVRFGGLIGYSRNPGNFFRKGRVVHNPESNVNLIHRDDCIGIISKIIDEEVWGEVFNCCADTHPTKREFYTQAANSLGNPAPEFAKSDDYSFKIVSNKKVKKFLYYEFSYPDLMKIKFDKSS